MLSLEDLLNLLVNVGASDLHLKGYAVPHIRIAGSLRPAEIEAPSVAEVEQLAMSILPADRAEILHLTGQVDFALSVPRVGRFRIHVCRQRGSLSIAFRHVVPGVPQLDQLGLPSVVQRLAEEQQGLVLVTGPRASGISTTVAAMVDHINTHRPVSVMSVEDPIEILHPDKRALVSQREVGTDCLSVTEGFAGVLRHDPDVIYLSDMMDVQVATQVLGAANSGLLVIACMQTPTASETIARIIELFEPHQQRQVRRTLGTALRGIVSQRLLDRSDGQGRVPAVEALVMTNRVFDRVVDPEATLEFDDLLSEGEYYGMQTFDQSLLDLYRQGFIGLRDALSSATHPKELRVALQSAGLASI